MKTGIEYGQVAWNPVTGCTKISAACQNCWAERMAKRMAGRCGYDKDEPFKVTMHPDRLQDPLKWKKPRTVLVSFMGDLFHPDVKDEWLDEIFGMIMAFRVLANMPNHTFIILTKRPGIMKQYFTAREPVELIKSWASAASVYTDNPDITFEDAVYSATCHDWDEKGRNSSDSEYKPWGYIQKLWPLPNVWLGVTAENQARADERIPVLLQIPAAVRFVSVEPMLGPVDLTQIDIGGNVWINSLTGDCKSYHPYGGMWKINESKNKLDWVICGGESGPGARPMHPDWVRSLRDQCITADVPWWFKQWGEYCPDTPHDRRKCILWNDGKMSWKVGKKAAGHLLDGQEWQQMPERVTL
jgi:protein gp37